MASAYCSEQVDRYLEFVSIPKAYRREANPARDIDFLTVLHTHQLSAIPYENLTLHYSVDHTVSLDPQHLYKKFIQNGRGGFCMEVGIFFCNILRALGFEVYSTGGRVRTRSNGIPQGDYLGWVHMVNIVTLPDDGARYAVDISFGGDGAIRPLLLVENHITQNIGTQELRLVKDILPGQSTTSQKVWVYQYRNATDRPWNSFYCFPELEFVQADFEIMSYSASKNSFQATTVLVIRFLRDERGVYGKVMLVGGEVKQNLGGKTVLLKLCKTEGERVEALRDLFGIRLTEEDVDGIKGWSTELVG